MGTGRRLHPPDDEPRRRGVAQSWFATAAAPSIQ